MPQKKKSVNKKLVPEKNKLSSWDDMVALAERNILWAKIRQDQLKAMIRIYQAQRDAGVPFP
jgi:hypothetical protein